MFMVRPELHRANEADYQKLHPLMAARGLLRQIVADDGRKFWLPPGEYVTVTAMNRAQVLAAAKACAAAVVPSFAAPPSVQSMICVVVLQKSRSNCCK